MKVVQLGVVIPDFVLDLPFFSAVWDINGNFFAQFSTDGANCKINFLMSRGDLVSSAQAGKLYSLPRLIVDWFLLNKEEWRVRVWSGSPTEDTPTLKLVSKRRIIEFFLQDLFLNILIPFSLLIFLLLLCFLLDFNPLSSHVSSLSVMVITENGRINSLWRFFNSGFFNLIAFLDSLIWWVRLTQQYLGPMKIWNLPPTATTIEAWSKPCKSNGNEIQMHTKGSYSETRIVNEQILGLGITRWLHLPIMCSPGPSTSLYPWHYTHFETSSGLGQYLWLGVHEYQDMGLYVGVW